MLPEVSKANAVCKRMEVKKEKGVSLYFSICSEGLLGFYKSSFKLSQSANTKKEKGVSLYFSICSEGLLRNAINPHLSYHKAPIQKKKKALAFTFLFAVRVY